MEATTVAELITRISEQFHGKSRVSTIISDDDSSMRSHCSHEGGLSRHVHEPNFLADPSHRCKIIGKPFFKLASMKKSECTLTTNDATRIKVYTACFFNQNRNKQRSLQWMQDHVWCVLHHYFDDHQFCTPDFCYKKGKKLQMKETILPHKVVKHRTTHRHLLLTILVKIQRCLVSTL